MLKSLFLLYLYIFSLNGVPAVILVAAFLKSMLSYFFVDNPLDGRIDLTFSGVKGSPFLISLTA
jgi:peptidoglycan/LPS O-acetylase OafA/YrhL